MKVSGKSLALSLLSIGGAFDLSRRLSRRRLVVLTYHRIIGEKEASIRPPDSLFTWEFERQIEYLVRHYHIATGEEVRLFLTEKRRLPGNSVFITFDDGYENNFIEAFPILLRHGATAAFFLTTGFIGRSGARLWFDKLDALLSLTSPGPVLDCLKRVGLPASVKEAAGLRQWIKGLARPERDAVIEGLAQKLGAAEHATNGRGVTNLMTWDQVREMANAGMTIGSHTVSHQILAKAIPEQVDEELVSSRLKIEKETGRPCWCFAYPNGERSDFRVSDQVALKAAGYTCAFTQTAGFISMETDHYALPRIPIPGSSDIRAFASRVTGLHHGLQRLRFGGTSRDETFIPHPPQ
jgi:peptidoglycan/xylan/chitin deacetylase (PgdA/CDA1 family)